MSALSGLKSHYDVVIVGGGVHGAALAMEAARRGRTVMLAEKNDFCSGTSANSLKIIHGGLRYLQSANFTRSRDSAREQSALMAQAPHLIEDLPCLMGTGKSLSRSRAAMTLGLWFYDNVVRAGLPRRPRGRVVPVSEANRLAGAELFSDCTGAALWHDARVLDTERLVLTYLKTAEAAGARILNYVSVEDVSRASVVKVTLRDGIGGDFGEVTAGCVLDTASILAPHCHWARAANLVLARRTTDCAVGLPLEQGRLFFVTPHDQATIVGTWYFPDRAADTHELDRNELDRCVADTRRLLPHLDIGHSAVSAIHVGRLPVRDRSRPLTLLEQPIIQPVAGDHRVISVTGVKYTTARPTARTALQLAGIPDEDHTPETRPWYGSGRDGESPELRIREGMGEHLDQETGERVVLRLHRQYGSAVAHEILELALRTEDGFERIPAYDAISAEIHYCINHEYCRTAGDFLFRRSGIGSVSAVPEQAARYCVNVMARRLDWSPARSEAELKQLSSRHRLVEPEL